MADDPVVQARRDKAEQWRIEHEADLAERARVRRAEKEAARAARSAEYAEHSMQLRRELAEAGLMLKAEKSARWAHRADPVNDPHVIEMARTFPGGPITPQEFLDWQAEQRRAMRKVPPLAEQLKTAPIASATGPTADELNAELAEQARLDEEHAAKEQHGPG